MAKAKKLPSGKWNCTVFSHKDGNGKRHYVSFTADTKQEAQRRALEFQINKKNQTSPQDITVGQAIENFINSKTNVLSPSTLKLYRSYIKQYAPLAQIRVGEINSLDLQNYVNALSENKNPKTVRNVYSLLLSSINLYTDRKFHVTLPQKKIPERHIPTDADVNMLISQANPTLKLAIVLGSQGVRRGEICSLKFGDILYDFNAIYIHSDMILGDNGWEYKEIPKTSASTRRVILPKEVIDMMGRGNENDYVIGVLPSTITSDFINLRNKLGLQCRFHDLRHYAASILHALGLPDAFIMERGGWASDSVLKSVYRHSLSDKSDNFTALANDYYKKNVLNTDVSRDGG